MAKKPYQIDEEVLEEEMADYSQDDINRRLTAKPNHYKKKIFFLVLLSLAVVSFGCWYVYQNIFGSVAYKQPDWLKNQLTNEEAQTQTIAELKAKDTDQDGLTDYEEIYLYHTSIFLPDTDSDGYTDAEEVKSGNDPLCPSGQDCSLLQLITPNTKLADVINEIKVDSDVTLQQAALTDFRKVLVESGIPQAEIDKLTDQDLMDLYQVMESNFTVSNGGQEITAEEVKKFLLDQPGADVETINAMSDQELLDIGYELLGQSAQTE